MKLNALLRYPYTKQLTLDVCDVLKRSLYCIYLVLALSPNVKAQTEKTENVLGRYHVTLDNQRGLIHTHACFDKPVSYLTSGVQSSRAYLAVTENQKGTFSANRRRLYLDKHLQCVDYRVDLNISKKARQAWQYENSWLVNNQIWLWRPVEKGQFEVTFVTPVRSPARVSVPWRKLKNSKTYLAGYTPTSWTSRMAFGDIKISSIRSDNKALNLALVGIDSTPKQNDIIRWMDQASDAVTGLYGVFPVNEAQILIVGIGRRKEAVPWGEVQRAGSAAAHLFIDQTRPIKQHMDDWTAVHELSHLLLPKIHYRDRWLSEGLASYYQNVARSQLGMLSPEQAWQKLNAGFDRGRKAQDRNLRSSRKTMHVYWGGAAFYLLADLRLRTLEHPTSLAKVLGDLKHCCLPSHKSWSARELTEKLDNLSNSRIFSSLLENEASWDRFPIATDFYQNASTQTRKNLNNIFKKNKQDVVTKD